jgi:DNA-binding transcriptional MerR regulator
LYTVDDMERVRFIQQVQGLGFSLAEIRELIGPSLAQSGCLRVGATTVEGKTF